MSEKTQQSGFDDENAEWTRTDFAKAVKFPAGVRLKDLKPTDLARMVEKPEPQQD
ncbi:hypothetical protein [Bradyrhizobium sp.]|uniref:hypothetical protein n=1 Tax=Bradyrhizobium sp. TaxID=376 RepID=UPI00239ECB0B|nr:hypothetical protein [Bradyrhizobium sp.]MDE2379959.1 hypothetical protein [Bradyrhizobium sp.]